MIERIISLISDLIYLLGFISMIIMILNLVLQIITGNINKDDTEF